MASIVGFHSVREALKAGRPVEQVQLQEGAGQRFADIVALCRKQGIPVRHVPRQALDRLAGGASHQGLVALLGEHAYAELEDVLTSGLLVVLDGVEDPHNLGAIIRTAYAAGAGAVVIPERRAAGLTPAAAKAAAGALEYLPVARVTNIARTLDRLKEVNYWIVGLDEHAEKSFREIDFRGNCALVLGGEGGGLHRLVREKCDFLAAIRTAGRLGSLNVSVAAGIVLFEAQHQRQAQA